MRFLRKNGKNWKRKFVSVEKDIVGARGKTIVCGILARGGRLQRVSFVRRHLMSVTVKRGRRESIMYTDRWRGYDSLMFSCCKHPNIDRRHTFRQ
jgi:hypothetical protein